MREKKDKQKKKNWTNPRENPTQFKFLNGLKRIIIFNIAIALEWL